MLCALCSAGMEISMDENNNGSMNAGQAEPDIFRGTMSSG